MKKYEYTSREGFSGDDGLLNKMAEQGWRCISIYMQSNHYIRYTFEREKIVEELPF